MDGDHSLAGFFEEPNGSYSAAYGPFALRSAFQPIFSQSGRGDLRLEAVEALIRPARGSEPVPPAQFFSLVEPADAAEVQQLCRRLHLANAGASGFHDTLVFLNIDPQFLTAYSDMIHMAESLVRLACAAGLSSSSIVCEIIEKTARTRPALEELVQALRSHNFKIAIDDYGAEDSDFDRVRIVKPDILKFDALWVQRFMNTSEGFALLGAMIRQFRDKGILTLFEGIEQHWQVAACRELGVRLMQGYALAEPQLAPIHPSSVPSKGEPVGKGSTPSGERPASFGTAVPPADLRPPHRPLPPTVRRAAFGRRGL